MARKPDLRPTEWPRAARGLWLAAALASCLAPWTAGCSSWRCRPSEANVALARQLSQQGLVEQQKGRLEQAQACFASALEKCPQDERARGRYAELLWQRGDRQQALAHMEEAVRLSGNDPESVVRLGQMCLEQGEIDRAARLAREALAANGQLAAAWQLQGDVLRRQHRWNDALAAHHRALHCQPHYPAAQLAAAEIYERLNQPQRALATLQALADQYPPGRAPPEVLARQGLALQALGRHDDAVAALAAAARQGQPSADDLCRLASAQLQQGDEAGAQLTLRAALERDPRHALAQRLQAALEQRRQALAAAVDRGS